MKKIAEAIVAIYLGLGSLSFIINIKFGILGIFVLLFNLNQHLTGADVRISLPITLLIILYVIITALPWIAGIYLKASDNLERNVSEAILNFVRLSGKNLS
jgi:hypothetical protein